MSKRRLSDSDIIIDVLEEASRRSHSDEPPVLKQYTAEELPIVLDLIEALKVRGTTAHVQGGLAVSLEGITFEGRQLRDELIAQRNAKRFSSRLKRAGLVALGWIGGLLTAGLKALIEHFLK